jgi:hypothetical protein
MKNTSNLSRPLFYQNIQNGKIYNTLNERRNSIYEKTREIVSIISFIALMTMTFAVSGQELQPEEGKGLVIFYRTKKMGGAAIKFSVKDSEKSYGQLKNGTIIKIQVEPGEHLFWSQVISSDAITLNIEEGKVYYVRGTVKMGAIAGRPKFNQVDEKKALKDMKGIK